MSIPVKIHFSFSAKHYFRSLSLCAVAVYAAVVPLPWRLCPESIFRVNKEKCIFFLCLAFAQILTAAVSLLQLFIHSGQSQILLLYLQMKGQLSCCYYSSYSVFIEHVFVSCVTCVRDVNYCLIGSQHCLFCMWHPSHMLDVHNDLFIPSMFPLHFVTFCLLQQLLFSLSQISALLLFSPFNARS